MLGEPRPGHRFVTTKKGNSANMKALLRNLGVACALVTASMGFAMAQSTSFPSHCVGCNFSNMHLHGADLHGANYVGSNLSNSDLSDANLRDARLTGVNLEGADLRGADLRGAQLIGTNFRGAQLAGAKFDRTSFTGANMAGMDLHGMNLTSAGFIGANLSGADLRNARFDGDELVGANMRDARLDGASLRNAWVCSHNHDTENGVSYDREVECIDLRGASVRGTVFTGVQLCDRDDGQRQCSPVDAATLRDKSRNALDGAVLP
jgi:uncharacterized protein YjbI with pentapeptide repeats